MSDRYALITGAAGLLASFIAPELQKLGYTTIGLRHKRSPATQISISELSEIPHHTKHLDLVLNLAGLPIMGRPWTQRYKKQLQASRAGLTKAIGEFLEHSDITCGHVISGSAIGYYGVSSEVRTEEDPPGHDFSARLCADWESAAHNLQPHCNTLTIIRTGLVLTPEGGFLDPFRLPTKLGMKMIFGDGRQKLSWIDYRDWIGAVLHILQHELEGTFNLTAPEPVSQRLFAQTLMSGRSLKIPVRLPRWLFFPLSEMKTLLIDGQPVMPDNLQKTGYRFQHPHLQQSLSDLSFP